MELLSSRVVIAGTRGRKGVGDSLLAAESPRGVKAEGMAALCCECGQ